MLLNQAQEAFLSAAKKKKRQEKTRNTHTCSRTLVHPWSLLDVRPSEHTHSHSHLTNHWQTLARSGHVGGHHAHIWLSRPGRPSPNHVRRHLPRPSLGVQLLLKLLILGGVAAATRRAPSPGHLHAHGGGAARHSGHAPVTHGHRRHGCRVAWWARWPRPLHGLAHHHGLSVGYVAGRCAPWVGPWGRPPAGPHHGGHGGGHGVHGACPTRPQHGSLAHGVGPRSHHEGVHGAAHATHVHSVHSQGAVHGAGHGSVGTHCHPRVHALTHGTHGAKVLRPWPGWAPSPHHHGLLHLYRLLRRKLRHGSHPRSWVWRAGGGVGPHGVIGWGPREVLQRGRWVSLHVHRGAVPRHHLHLRRCPLGRWGATRADPSPGTCHGHGGLGRGLLRWRGVGGQVLDGVGRLGLDVHAGVAYRVGREGRGGQPAACPAHRPLLHTCAHGGVGERMGVGLVARIGWGLDLWGGGHALLLRLWRHASHWWVAGGRGDGSWPLARPWTCPLHLPLGHAHADTHPSPGASRHHHRLLLLLLLLELCFPEAGPVLGHTPCGAHAAVHAADAGHGGGAARPRHADVRAACLAAHGVHLHAGVGHLPVDPVEVVDLADVGVVDELFGCARGGPRLAAGSLRAGWGVVGCAAVAVYTDVENTHAAHTDTHTDTHTHGTVISQRSLQE